MAKILAIDDKPDNLTSVSALLRTSVNDCSVITANSGLEGVEKARIELPDTILLDVVMPGVDGYEVCKVLKSDPATKHIPVVMLTAIKADPQDRAKGLRIGADAFLTKPIDYAELTAQVGAMLRIKRAEDLLREEKGLLEETVDERTEALRKSEEAYRAIVTHSPDLIITTDSEGIVTYVSPKCREVVGHPPERFLHARFPDIIHPEDQARCVKAWQDVYQGRSELSDFEYRIIDGSDNTRWVSHSAKMIMTDDRPTGMHNNIRDITARKRMESELRQAHKMESIGTLSGGIAHDFNNILGIILGNTEMAIMDVPEWNPAIGNLQEIKRACERARDVVRQILAFSRKAEHRLVPVEICSVVSESLKLIRSTVPTTIEIHQNIDESTGAILGDATQINQILLNLCTNAKQAMQAGGGMMTVTLEKVCIDEKDRVDLSGLSVGDHVKLSVGDTGPGIAQGQIDRIFDPYYTTKDVGEGTGMGLAVVHGIVQQHNGAIAVSSEVGVGTTFDIYFPTAEASNGVDVQRDESNPGGRESVLFVDDEQEMARVYQTMLERLGYTVDVRGNGVEALEAFRAEPDRYDLIITDQTMPQMTGQALAREAMAIRPEIPVILCTGHSDAINEAEAEELGIGAFILKPIAMTEIAVTVRSVLDTCRRQ